MFALLWLPRRLRWFRRTDVLRRWNAPAVEPVLGELLSLFPMSWNGGLAYQWSCMMPRFDKRLLMVSLFGICCVSTHAEELWTLPRGRVDLVFDPVALDRFGLSIPSATSENGRIYQSLDLDKYQELDFVVEDRRVTKLLRDSIALSEGLRIVSNSGAANVFDFVIATKDDSVQTVASPELGVIDRDIALLMAEVRFSFTESTQSFALPAEQLLISDGLARALGDPRLANKRIGHVVVGGQAQWIGGDRLAISRPDKQREDSPVYASSVAPSGPDVTFCELYGLSQYGRVGSVVGLAVATTSWNVGTEDAMWFAIPQEQHPKIGQNLFRLKDDRFEQIGQSWLKHGFYALGDEQCDVNCTFEPGHSQGNWLGVGCTDTYSSFLNASQSSLGPRYEVNPWTGAWEYTGSHMDPGSNPPGHSAISHRLQVHDNDLTPLFNPGAQYFVEGYYVTSDDVFHDDSAAWKPVTVVGNPGGTWSFGMSGFSTPPTIGFAIDAWTGATKTILAQEFPVLVGEAPDGRCILGAKATDLGGGQWHYEYALYNMDMDRKVDSFSIPIRPGTTVTNVGFHNVLHHDEPYSNDPWTSSVESNAVVWSTSANPLRWGTLYNFRFDANVAPFDTTVTLSLYEPGTPDSVSGTTTGPDPRDPTCAIPDSPVAIDTGAPMNRYIALDGQNPGEPTAIRVKLNALLRGQNQSQISSSFDGEVRWVGPPTEHDAGPGANPPTFMASQLQCTPYFTDWSAIGTVYVYGDAVLPNSAYDAQMFHQACAPFVTDESKFSSPVSVDTALWGDVVPPLGTWDIPDTQPNFADISAIVGTFIGRPGAAHRTHSQLQPNVPIPDNSVSFADVNADLQAYMGMDYLYAGPSACP